MEDEMHSLQIFNCCVDWLPVGERIDLLLAVTIGYLAIAKVELLKLLRKAPRNGVHRCAALPRQDVTLGSRRRARDIGSSPSHAIQEPNSASETSAAPKPSRHAPYLRMGAMREQADAWRTDLTPLDWTSITCQNAYGCARAAGYVVELHAVDHCSDGATNPMGNVTEILCGPCLAALRKSINRHIARVNTRGQQPRCLTCGVPLELTADILRSVTLLNRTTPTNVTVGGESQKPY